MPALWRNTKINKEVNFGLPLFYFNKKVKINMYNNWDANIYGGPHYYFNLQDNGLLVIWINNQQFVIDLKNIEYYEDSSPKHDYHTRGGINNIKRMTIRYKSGKEYYYWIDINNFRWYYVQYLLWYR